MEKNIRNILKIKSEINEILSDLDQREKKITDEINQNSDNITLYKLCLENIIEEYHFICKKIYK